MPGLVSVIIPTFNHGRFLAEAIQSALNQERDEIDIVVVDDGSTDDSPAVAGSFGGRVRYIWQENTGLPGARNTGIRAARGEYLAFLDADDAWLPGFLPEVMARWGTSSAVGAVHTGFCCVDADGHPLPQRNLTTVADNQMYDRLLDGEFFIPSSVVARRACFERVGLFDEALRASEDWDMWLRVAREYRFCGISRPLVKYRIHSGNMSADPDYMLRYQLMVVGKHFGQPDGPPDTWPLDRQRAYAAVYRYAAQGYYLRGELERSRCYLRRTLEANIALSDSVDLYYELGSADQALGWRPTGGEEALQRNAAFLASALKHVFEAPDRPERLKPRRRRAVGHAYLALGLLAYERQLLDLVRRYMCKALSTTPALWMDKRVWSRLAKSLLGRRLLDASKACFGHRRAARDER
jgi:glycosyltransferase involved in cell wall biosynthesis